MVVKRVDEFCHDRECVEMFPHRVTKFVDHFLLTATESNN